jgi:hypothetical protein
MSRVRLSLLVRYQHWVCRGRHRKHSLMYCCMLDRITELLPSNALSIRGMKIVQMQCLRTAVFANSARERDSFEQYSYKLSIWTKRFPNGGLCCSIFFWLINWSFEAEKLKRLCLLVTEIGMIILLHCASLHSVCWNFDMENMLVAAPHLATLKYHLRQKVI